MQMGKDLQVCRRADKGGSKISLRGWMFLKFQGSLDWKSLFGLAYSDHGLTQGSLEVRSVLSVEYVLEFGLLGR